MLLIIPSAVVSSNVLAVLSYLSLPSHFRHTRLGVGLGIGTKNSVIYTLFSIHEDGNRPCGRKITLTTFKLSLVLLLIVRFWQSDDNKIVRLYY